MFMYVYIYIERERDVYMRNRVARLGELPGEDAVEVVDESDRDHQGLGDTPSLPTKIIPTKIR